MLTLTSLEATIPLNLQLIFAGLLGLCFGSFGTMLLWRIPRRESFGGRSCCTQCNHILEWYDLIPVVSYFILLGRCRYCKKVISTRYLAIEVCTTALFFLFAYKFRDLELILLAPLVTAAYCTLLIAFYDSSTKRIPDALITVMVLAALFYQVGKSALVSNPEILRDAFLGAGIFFIFFGGLWLIRFGKLIGSGDVLLGTSIGIILGLKGSFLALFLAYIIGALIASVLLLMNKVDRKDALPFGPFLSCGALLTIFLNEWLLSTFGGFMML